jgi:protease IV
MLEESFAPKVSSTRRLHHLPIPHFIDWKGAAMNAIKTKWLSHPLAKVLLWLALPLVVGILLALLVPRPVIGIVYLRDTIDANTAGDLDTQIRYAYDHPEINAVVLVLDSPGGTVADTESTYLELIRLRQKKPVVTVVENMSASGAYYLAVGTDYIMVQPSSEVGNVGVRTTLPMAPLVLEEEVSTGPYKFFGDSRDATLRILDPLKQGFYRAVVLGRGKALKATPEDVLSGKIYIGTEAVRLGLADSLGTQSDAIVKAASMAHVWNFAVRDLRKPSGLPDYFAYSFFFETKDGELTSYPKKAGTYFLYIPADDGRLP